MWRLDSASWRVITKAWVAFFAAVLAFVSNIAFLWVIYHYPSARFSTAIYFVLNAVILSIFYLLIWWMMPVRIRQGERAFFWAGWLLATMLPVLGIALIAFAAIALHWYKEDDPERHLQTVSAVEFVQEKDYGNTFFGEGGAWARANTAEMKTVDRIKSISAMNIHYNQFSNRVNRTMSQDSDDEVRLYAFSLVDKQETRLNALIIEYRKILENAKLHNIHAQAKAQLAQVYWDMCYLDLSQDSVRDYMMTSAEHYANEALVANPSDSSVLVLLARIALAKGQEKRARERFEQAIALGTPASQVMPYLAELAFRSRQLAEVRRYLNYDDSLKYVMNLAPVVDFWLRGADAK
jgi:tetratricopeptide (TPR) repeat protein